MVEEMLDPLTDSLWDILDAMPLGNRVAEIKWAYASSKAGGKKLLNVAALKVKPRQATAFVVDAYLNVVGILGRPPGFSSPFIGGWDIDPKNPPLHLIPRSRFAVLTYRPRDSDPRGSSILRAAYEPWWRKRQVFPEYLRYLTQFAGPSLWGTVPEKSMPTAQIGPDQPIVGAPLVGPETKLARALQQIRNGTAGAFPFGTVINAVPVQAGASGGNPFQQAVGEANVEITKVILTQQLATEEAQHQTRAAAEVHENVMDTIIRQGKQSLVRMIRRDILQQWVIYNWGDKAKYLAPKVSLGLVEEQDRSGLMTAISSLVGSGILVPSQYQVIDDMLGLPVRTAEEVPPSAEERQQMAMELASAQGRPAVAPPSEGEEEKKETPEDEEEEDEEENKDKKNGKTPPGQKPPKSAFPNAKAGPVTPKPNRFNLTGRQRWPPGRRAGSGWCDGHCLGCPRIGT